MMVCIIKSDNIIKDFYTTDFPTDPLSFTAKVDKEDNGVKK